MLNVGLSAAEHKEFHDLCVTHHKVVIITYLMDNNHNVIANISDQMIDGQVDVDYDADIARKLSASVFDPNYALGLDAANVNMGALFADRMLCVVYQVWRPDETYWFGIPIFTGPISKVNRTGNFLSLEAQGKEYFMMGSSWWKRTYKKGLPRHAVIRDLLLTNGEAVNHYWVPDSRYKVPKDFSISYDNPTWPTVEAQAKAMGRMAYYDGFGNGLVSRGQSSKVRYTFRKFCSEPEINYNYDNLINSVIVIGAKPKGRKSRLMRRFVAPSSHPMNPYNIGRLGWDGHRKGRFQTQVIDNTELTTIAEIYRVGRKALHNGLLQAVEASFTAPVIPDLEELDAYNMVHEGATTSAALRKFTIPLTGAPIGTFGYLRKINPNKAVIRRAK